MHLKVFTKCQMLCNAYDDMSGFCILNTRGVTSNAAHDRLTGQARRRSHGPGGAQRTWPSHAGWPIGARVAFQPGSLAKRSQAGPRRQEAWYFCEPIPELLTNHPAIQLALFLWVTYLQ